MTSLADLPVPAVVALAVLVTLQLGLQIVALVSLCRAPPARVSLGGRKWLWALIILVGELVGPIAFFVAGRLPTVAEESTRGSADGLDRQARVVEALYGPVDQPPQSADQTGTAEAGDARRRR